ncbi:MAG TPA: PIG-L family deacetylase [Acidobacteriaceae bacterium]|jgi:LmbE family N-acetylglucosaminyl deacetylase|nr:PIG-L family deacetylase [Acidobacteriaceae bacterium]
MHRFAPVALATFLAASAPAYLHAQNATSTSTPFTDPANLRGERVSPRTGRELPIDGGDADNALGLQQLLRKLSTRASILNIVAHPDDEDGGMLTLYARGYGARVADLSLTRGEGGQNAMTGDFEDALGLLRTQELLANDRYTGVTQMFGTEVDFGFSKTKAESFSKWGHDRVLYDVVRAIRLYRPLVLTATFIGNPTDGHGQHQVSGQIAQEAFVAAGDPNIFPELTREGILPWQPLKMYARVPSYAISAKGLFDYATGQYVPAQFTNYVTGVTSTTPPTPDIVIHEGTTDPLLTTCAANPSDLPPQLKPASSSTLRDAPSSLSSFRNAGGSASPSATDCRPLTYVQFARIGLGLQRTQIGPGVRNAPAGRFDVPYHLYGSRLCGASVSLKDCHPETERREGEGPAVPSALASEPNFFDGIDTSITGIATLAPNAPPFVHFRLAEMTEKITSASKDFDSHNPEALAPALASALQSCDALIGLTATTAFDNTEKANILHELRIKRVQLNDALVLALGLSTQTTATSADMPANKDAVATTVLRENAALPLTYTRGWSENSLRSGIGDSSHGDGASAWTISQQHPLSRECSLTASQTPATRPYFTRTDIEQPYYNLLNPDLRNAPATPPAFTCWAELTYEGVPLKVGAVARSEDQPASFIPPASVLLPSHAQVLPLDQQSLLVTLIVHPVGVRVEADLPPGWKVTPDIEPKHSPPGFKQLRLQPSAPLSAPLTITAIAMPHGAAEITEGFRPVGYGSLPRTNFYTPATDRIVPVDLKLPPPDKRRIGYLEGTGDDVPAALASIGLKPTILTVADLTPEKLKAFDTVILGVRTYNAHPDLHGAPTQALLDFARNGGNVVVQYQTAEFTAADAPFPLELGYRAEKVVDETDPVEILHPQSTLFTTPNHIVTSDFDHWIEERGHGFLGSWDPRYTALTETHDPGQAPQKGGLIAVQLGRGRWTYCAFALYRQLPEAVPGAFRLFTNLLNL